MISSSASASLAFLRAMRSRSKGDCAAAVCGWDESTSANPLTSSFTMTICVSSKRLCARFSTILSSSETWSVSESLGRTRSFGGPA